MRLDKFLKDSRLIKRRTVAKEAADNNLVMLNKKNAKPSSEVKEGDIISITFKGFTKDYRIDSIKPPLVSQLLGREK